MLNGVENETACIPTDRGTKFIAVQTSIGRFRPSDYIIYFEVPSPIGIANHRFHEQVLALLLNFEPTLRFRVCLLSPMTSEIRRGLPADGNGKNKTTIVLKAGIVMALPLETELGRELHLPRGGLP